MWSIHRQSVRTQLLVLLGVALWPMLGLLLLQIHHEQQQARTQAAERVQILAAHTAQTLGQMLGDHESMLQRIAGRPGVRAMDANACDPLVREFVGLYPEYTNLIVVDTQGRTVCSFLNQTMPRSVLIEIPGYAQALQTDGMTLGGAVMGPLSGRWVASLFYPIRDAAQQVVGLVVLPVDLQKMGQRVLASVPLETLVVVGDGQGRIVLRSQDAENRTGMLLPAAMQALAQNQSSLPQAKDLDTVTSADGVERLFALAPVPRSQWMVFSGVPKEVVFAPSQAAFVRGVALAAGIALLAVVLAWRIAKRIVRPIDALHRTAIAVANGRWQARVQPDGGAQELHAVATQFNRMLDHRDAVQAVLQDSQARLKILADLSSDWYWEQDAEHRTTRVYGRVAEGTGLPETSYLGKTRWDLNALNMDAAQWAAHRAVLDAHQPFRDLEIERLDAQGQRRWALVSGAPVFDTEGRFTGYRGVGRDITEFKRQELERLHQAQKIEALSHRLVQAQEETRRHFSRELHDRTSPNLAALRIDLDMLAKATPEQRSAPEYGERLEDMRALIEDTTMNVRDICAELHPPVFDCGGLLGVVRSYAVQVARRTGLQVDVLCPHGEVRLPAEYELALFRIVQESLTNCAKHAQAHHATVQLQLQTPPLLICITDDGLGFDAKVQEAGLGSAGLGLIYMRETAEFVGGRLCVQAAAGAGTRICVEIARLPETEPNTQGQAT